MLVTAAAAFVLVIAAIALYLPLGRRLQQVDHPNARSAHERPTLSSGGLPVILALLLALLLGVALGVLELARREWVVLGLAAVLCATGLVDDRRPLRVTVRLAIFLAVSAVLVFEYLPAWSLPARLCAAVAVGWLVNLYNFMDGIDGLAALQCCWVAAALGALAYLVGGPAPLTTVAFAVAAAYAAFLRFNWPPAGLFMGDAGSLAAGLLLGWLGLWGGTTGSVSPWAWALLMSPFLLDATITLGLRLLRGERVTEAHSQHVYQRLARHHGGHLPVILGLLALQALWLTPLAFLLSLEIIPSSVALFLGLFPQLAFIAKATRIQ